jgi:hypothetical protein
MKTIIHILTALFVMNFTFLSAGNPRTIIVKTYGSTYKISIYNDISDLGPVTPKEALFIDSEPRPASEINRLAPITPREATFEESKDEIDILSIDKVMLQQIAPETPKEAEFEDDVNDKTSGIDPLAPVSPLMASFED